MLDGARGAIDFYEQALGTEEIGERVKMDDGRIVNARIDVNGASVMLMDPCLSTVIPPSRMTASICIFMSMTLTAGSSGPSRPDAP